MEFRLANTNDLKIVKDIFVQASEYMKKEGNDIQWQGVDFVSDENLLGLLEHNNFYVVINNNEIVGFYKLQYGNDKTYDVIRDGKWLNNETYVTIHRFAVKYHKQGIASLMLNHIEEEIVNKGIYNIRIDTHKKNISMQGFLNKNNFVRCGEIACACDFNDPKQLREAYQKVIKIH